MRQTVTIPPAEIDRQLALCDQIHTLLEDRPGQKLAFVDTYGCQQNEADSERLRGYLARMGYAFSDTEEGADLVLLNPSLETAATFVDGCPVYQTGEVCYASRC